MRNIETLKDGTEELPIPGLIPNQNVGTQDIKIMAVKAQSFWKELEHLYKDTDWQWFREPRTAKSFG